MGIDQLTVATPRAQPLSRIAASWGVRLAMRDSAPRHEGNGAEECASAHASSVRRYDTSVGGIGGSLCPPTAVGILAARDPVPLFEDLAISTGIDLDAPLHLGRMVVGPARSAAAEAGRVRWWTSCLDM